MPATYFFLILLVLGIGLCSPSGQAEESSKRIKIGVALSGGGARGLAHIGVLEALQELRVPIDYLAGTSMGGIIGGLYASGLSTEELRNAVLKEIDWSNVLNNRTYREQLSFREKQNQRRFFQVEIGLGKKGLTAPSGFVSGQNLFMELKRLTRNIFIDDFSNLSIPFKAVATDLRTAQPYVLEKGDLALALRASMAVPFAFAPVEIDGHLLADGNILNNLPVDVVRDMGADVVIAVNISTPLSEIDTSSSFLTVTKQAITVALVQNTRRALQLADIVITPSLDKYGTTDFEKAAELILEGQLAVKKIAPVLKGIGLLPKQYEDYRSSLRARRPASATTITPKFIEFTGNQRTSKEILQSKVEPLLNHPVSLEEINLVANHLMYFNEVEQVTYQIQKDMQGKPGILFNVHEKSWGPNYFRFGLNVSTTFKDKISFSTLARHEKLNVNKLGAEWVNELEIGTGYLFHTEFYQPLDYQQHRFIMPFAELERRFSEVYDQGESIAEYENNILRVGLHGGRNFDDLAIFRIGLFHEDVASYLRIGNSKTLHSPLKKRQTVLNLEYGFDDLNDRIFATRGMVSDINANLYYAPLGSEDTYQEVELYLRHHYPLFPAMTWISELTLSTVLNSGVERSFFSVGGPHGLTGYAEHDIKGNDVLLLRFGGLLNPSTLAGQGTISNIRILGLFHAGNAWKVSFDDLQMKTLKDLHYGGVVALVWDTRFGTIQLGTGYTTGGNARYFLSLGSFLRN